MSPNLSIKQLETFRAVMRSGSLSIAAKSLYRSQPAISTMIASLEKELGLTLFKRHKGRLTPTPEAYFLLEEADTIVERLTRATQLMAEVKNLKKGKLRVSCMPVAALFFMPHVIANFVKERPEVEVSMMMRSSSIVQDWVASQQYDIGFCEMPTQRNSYNTHPVALKGVCAVNKNNILSKLNIITPRDLDNIPLATLYSQHRFSENIKALFSDKNIIYRPQFELQNYISGFEFVEQNLCCCICDEMSAASYKFYKSGAGNIIFIPFSPEIKYECAIITPSHKPMSQLSIQFKNTIIDGLDSFISGLD